jgi:hypothetical protein
MLDQFLESGQAAGHGQRERQVLSLGAGFDTTWFNLQARFRPCQRSRLIASDRLLPFSFAYGQRR